MAVCFLTSTDGSTIVGLDSTTSVTYTRTVSVTKNTMFSGVKISDHAHPDLPIINFSGVVTSSKIRNTYPSPQEFRSLVDELIDSQEVMEFFGTDDGSIPDLDSCYITSFDVTRDATYSNSLLCNISLMQLDISNAVTATTITAPAVSTDGQLADNPDSASDGSKTDNTPEVRQTVARQLGVSLSDLASGNIQPTP